LPLPFQHPYFGFLIPPRRVSESRDIGSSSPPPFPESAQPAPPYLSRRDASRTGQLLSFLCLTFPLAQPSFVPPPPPLFLDGLSYEETAPFTNTTESLWDHFYVPEPFPTLRSSPPAPCTSTDVECQRAPPQSLRTFSFLIGHLLAHSLHRQFYGPDFSHAPQAYSCGVFYITVQVFLFHAPRLRSVHLVSTTNFAFKVPFLIPECCPMEC